MRVYTNQLDYSGPERYRHGSADPTESEFVVPAPPTGQKLIVKKITGYWQVSSAPGATGELDFRAGLGNGGSFYKVALADNDEIQPFSVDFGAVDLGSNGFFISGPGTNVPVHYVVVYQYVDESVNT